MDTRGKILQNYERRWDLQRLSHQPAYHRRHPIIHPARRLAAHSPGWGFFVPFEPSLETGGALPVLVGRDVVASLDSTFFRVSFGSLLPPPQNSRKW